MIVKTWPDYLITKQESQKNNIVQLRHSPQWMHNIKITQKAFPFKRVNPLPWTSCPASPRARNPYSAQWTLLFQKDTLCMQRLFLIPLTSRHWQNSKPNPETGLPTPLIPPVNGAFEGTPTLCVYSSTSGLLADQFSFPLSTYEFSFPVERTHGLMTADEHRSSTPACCSSSARVSVELEAHAHIPPPPPQPVENPQSGAFWECETKPNQTVLFRNKTMNKILLPCKFMFHWLSVPLSSAPGCLFRSAKLC